MKFNTGGQFEKAPSGLHIARCYAVIDLGTQVHPGYQGGPERAQRDVRISFELPNEKMEGKYNQDHAGKPFSVHLTCKQSLHPKARLTKMLEGWRGKKFDKESAASFDPKQLPGKPCRVSLVDDGDYTNIDSISPLSVSVDPKTKKRVTESCPKQVNPSVFFSLEPDEFDAEVFAKLSDKTQEKIKRSPEWAKLNEGSPGEEPQADAPEGSDSVTGSDDEPF